MEFSEVVEKRRSVRKFTHEAVPENVVLKAFREAVKAPNSSNMQPWEFYWVQNPEKKAEIVKACFSQPAAASAAEIVVIVARIDYWRRNCRLMLEALGKLEKAPRSAWTYYKRIVPMNYGLGPFSILGRLRAVIFFIVGFFRAMPRGPFTKRELSLVAVKSTALAAENFMLSIVDQGYACCPMEGFDECRVSRVIGLPWSARIVMCVGLGVGDPRGVYSPERIRFDENLFLKRL